VHQYEQVELDECDDQVLLEQDDVADELVMFVIEMYVVLFAEDEVDDLGVHRDFLDEAVDEVDEQLTSLTQI
jgi:hypothetical protein